MSPTAPGETTPSTSNPRFSIVSAVYNVLPYLDEFISSIEAQTLPAGQLQVILVDDGSTDGTADRIAQWRSARPDLVTIVSKENGGQASARNLGLEYATGEWVTFTDPDDMLEPDALLEVAKFIDKNPQTQLAAMKRVLFMDSTNSRVRHPLDKHFHRNRLVDLDGDGRYFYGSAPCAFFRRAEIERFGLRFSELIRPSFEDGYFCDEYLLRVKAPLVGFIAKATYLYRKRADASSTLSVARTDPRRYTTLFELGYLGIMEESVRQRGSVPGWIQTHILYELSYFFGQEQRGSSPLITPIVDEVQNLLRQIAAHLEERWVRSFTLRPFRPEWRDLLLHGFGDTSWHTTYAVADRVDMRQRLVRLSYRYVGERPAEEITVDGSTVKPVYDKVRSQPYFQRTLIRQRIVWVPYGALQLSLDGQPLNIETAERPPTRTVFDSWRARDVHTPRFVARGRDRDRRRLRRPLGDRLVTRLARTALVRRFFNNAWVFIDRLHDADDSAEHLFRHVRTEHREVNAWFLVDRHSVHGRQLRADGFKRVISPGGLPWMLLMLNCSHLISSHADAPIVAPKRVTRMAVPLWRFTFLQHGVTKDDLSGWLNPKKIDVFVTSTPAEYESVVGDDTGYEYTAKEVVLTGLPRFDKVLEAGRKVPPGERDLILVAPTWRQWLVTKVSTDDQRWVIDEAAFRASQYAQQWQAFVNSARLREVAREAGLRIGVLLHPNLQPVASSLDLDPGVELFDFAHDVRRLFARARVVVTDYSSMFFNAAYIERPVVYFQFDRDAMLAGDHVGARGYFDYERDGFGPVASDLESAVAATVTAIDEGPVPAAEYLARIEAAFPNRDGQCSERVYKAIRASTRKVRRAYIVDDGEAAGGVAGVDDGFGGPVGGDDVGSDADEEMFESTADDLVEAPVRQDG